MSGFKRLSLTSCAILLSLSTVAYAEDIESGYTLTRVDEKGENTITKFEWNSETNKMEPVYYRVDLAQTEYGSGEGVKYFGWSTNSQGQREFKELPSPSPDMTTITSRYDNTDLHERINTDQQGADVTGNFIGNSAYAGGAIDNDGTIGDITGDFVGNSARAGGAIYNYKGAIGDITGDFVGNYARAGGAIDNDGTIGDITGDFVGNYAKSEGETSSAAGGAIYNYGGTIGSITGNFVGNYITSEGDKSEVRGGAIYNIFDAGKIGDITGNFIGNYAKSNGELAGGGAISNRGNIDNIIGDFIGNKVFAVKDAFGGAIYNHGGYLLYGTIASITGDFIGNEVSAGNNASGGAINNFDDIGDITGDFIGNEVSAGNNAYGGAIGNGDGEQYYGGGNIGNITGDFIGNYAKAAAENSKEGEASASGGAIYNDEYGTIGNITGDFIGNYVIAEGETSIASGGAIFNGQYRYEGTIGDITGDFVGNYAKSEGETSSAAGGAIYNYKGAIGDITGDFVGNYAKSSGGKRTTAAGGAIANDGTIGDITGDFIGNYAAGEYAYGGAIYNYGTIGQTTPDGNIMPDSGIVNSSFINNYASANGENGFAMGGAIMTFTDLNIVAKDGYTSVFSGNYTEVNGERDDNAIYAGYGSTINFEMKNGGKFVMADNIRGEAAPQPASLDRSLAPASYKVNITGDHIDNTTFYMLNDMYDANLSVGQTTLNTINDSVHTYGLNTFTLTNDIKLAVDVDLANSEMDKYTANNYGQHQGNLTVSGMNLISDSTGEHTEILFAEQGLKDNVLNGTGELPDKYQTAYTPIYKYNVSYDNRADGGYFLFDRGGMNGNSSESFNPSVLSTPVSNQAGSQAVINETVRFAFQHMDLFSQLPFHQRMAIINNNRYAGVNNGVNNGVNAISASRYDVRTDKPQYNSEFEMINKGFWVKPFTSFETINLNNGPDVDAITYGTLVGFDSNFKELKRGWYNVQSIYGGYNGSQLSYDGVDTTLNGGVLGLTETFYKGNFFTALTATAGANVGSSKTMYGNEDFTALLAGIGSKSGYNFEFKNGKYILQPILFMNYSFVNTFDYTNAAGVKIDSDPLHTFQINPQLKFISNLKNGWQPYASVGMVWNVLNSSKVRANDVILPKMSVDPYVEYGVGLQRNWKDRFTGFAQAMVRNGGRNGVALTFGFRWAIGKGDDL